MTAATAAPSPEALEAHLDAATTMLGLSIVAGSRASVLAHLAATMAAARLVSQFDLGDEVEPAPVFRP